MKQENEEMNQKARPGNPGERPLRKGLHRYFHISRLDWYLCAIISMVFAVFGLIELIGLDNLRFIRMSNSFQFALLFLILGMVARIYYKLFEEQYDKKE